MPWKEACIMDTRLEFVLRALRENIAFNELCKEYGVSRKTGYKWKERFLEHGPAGLEDLSRRPKNSPKQVAEDVLCQIIRIKDNHRAWGPRKVREVYARQHPNAEVLSESTVKRVLEKAGLVKKRKRRASTTCGRIDNRIVPEAPNALWTVDFKGWWYTGNRQRCEPLTVRDEFTRFVLCANPLDNAKSITVRHEFERVFERYGMPDAIRSDNGSPFACTRAPLGLSKLSAWWIAHGITIDRIPPARPDQNGGHERMHRDMAMEVERCPETDLNEQRGALDTWRHTFNFERPHEALGMRVPGDLYRKSDRLWTQEPEELTYPAGYLKRKVSVGGQIGMEGAKIAISTALAGWHIGLKPCADHEWLAWFGPLALGSIDMRTETFKAVDTMGG